MMTAPIDSELLTFAERIAAEAAAITLHWFQSRDLKVDLKKDNTEVTDADKAVEEYLRKEIGKEFPHDTIIGEESDNFSGTAKNPTLHPPAPHNLLNPPLINVEPG